jgi:peptidoglycan-N-acetylglucosamine deacetylase
MTRICRQLIRAGMARVLPRCLFLTRGPRSARSVCLTFDDGPDPEHTPLILDVLKREGVPATFFVVGRRAARHPDLVRRVAAEGHALGHHSYSHSPPEQTSAGRLVAEVGKTGDVLTRIVGFSPALFRPPHGKVTAAKLWGLWRRGMTVVLWNVDPKDFSCGSADEL